MIKKDGEVNTEEQLAVSNISKGLDLAGCDGGEESHICKTRRKGCYDVYLSCIIVEYLIRQPLCSCSTRYLGSGQDFESKIQYQEGPPLAPPRGHILFPG